jgi:hypothetical protein
MQMPDPAAKPTSKPTAGQKDRHVAFTADARRVSGTLAKKE